MSGSPPAQAAARPDLLMNLARDEQLGEMFRNPESWSQTRAQLSGLLFADHTLAAHSDDDLRLVFDSMRRWSLRLELEVGAVKHWGRTAEAAFAAGRKHWDRIEALGGVISSMVMDEPLSATHGEKRTLEDGLAQTVAWIGLVRQAYPAVRIGDAEPYPSQPLSEHRRWLGLLQQRLHEAGGPGLAFYRIDPDWISFTKARRGSWAEVKAIQDDCASARIPFSLIYWASDYPSKAHDHVATDQSWEDGIMREGGEYAAAGGHPDQFVVESWLDAPSRNVPESAAATFTRSVDDFAARYVRRG